MCATRGSLNRSYRCFRLWRLARACPCSTGSVSQSFPSYLRMVEERPKAQQWNLRRRDNGWRPVARADLDLGSREKHEVHGNPHHDQGKHRIEEKGRPRMRGQRRVKKGSENQDRSDGEEHGPPRDAQGSTFRRHVKHGGPTEPSTPHSLRPSWMFSLLHPSDNGHIQKIRDSLLNAYDALYELEKESRESDRPIPRNDRSRGGVSAGAS
jgi:hypothetical protein